MSTQLSTENPRGGRGKQNMGRPRSVSPPPIEEKRTKRGSNECRSSPPQRKRTARAASLAATQALQNGPIIHEDPHAVSGRKSSVPIESKEGVRYLLAPHTRGVGCTLCYECICTLCFYLRCCCACCSTLLCALRRSLLRAVMSNQVLTLLPLSRFSSVAAAQKIQLEVPKGCLESVPDRL